MDRRRLGAAGVGAVAARLCRRVVAAVTTLAIVATADGPGCDALPGKYRSSSGLVVDLKVTNNVTVSGKWSDPAHLPFVGILVGNCFGEATIDGAQASFRMEDDGSIAFSTGAVWTPTASPSGDSWRGYGHMGAQEAPPVTPDDEGDAHTAHGAGHGGGHGEHGEHAHKVATTVATMLFGMFFASVGVLYLVHFPDPDIRLYSYSMISTTMSVFAAVLLNQAIITFIFDQVIKGKWPRGLGMEVDHHLEWKIGLVYLSLGWMALSLICWRFRIDARLLRSSSGLGSHLLGFAGIFAADAGMRSGRRDDTGTLGLSSLTIVGAVVIMWGLKFVARKMRERFLHVDHSVQNMQTAIDEHTEEIIDEAEDETIALVTSFLIVILLCHFLLGKLPHIHGAEPHITMQGAGILMVSGVIFAVLSTSTRLVSKRMNLEGLRKKAMLLVVNTEAMVTSWAFLWGGMWMMQLIFKNHKRVSSDLARVINAFIATSVCVALIFLLDTIADACEERERRPRERDAKREEEKELEILEMQLLERKRTIAQHHGFSERVREIGEEIGSMGRRSSAAAEHLQSDIRTWMPNMQNEVSTLLRITLNSLGFLVALAWDKAFDSAEETVVEFIYGTLQFHHRVIVKVMLAILLAGFVTPAWMKYIVPITMKDRDAHFVEIRRLATMERRYAKGKVGHHSPGSEPGSGSEDLSSESGE